MFKALNQGVDEDGFICVIAKDFYSGFVAEDWTLDQLLAHVAQQGNLGSIFIAYPGPNHADAPLLIDVPSTPQPAVPRSAWCGEVRTPRTLVNGLHSADHGGTIQRYLRAFLLRTSPPSS